MTLLNWTICGMVVLWSFIGGIEAEKHRGCKVVISHRLQQKGPAEYARSLPKDDSVTQSSDEQGAFPTLAAALTLLWKAESGYGEKMSGDGGYAKGHFQQHCSHWVEGCKMLGVSWVYPDDTNNLAKAAAITAANWAKYAPQALKDGNLELLARSHRLPSAPYRADNDSYVSRVLKGENHDYEKN